MEVYEEIKEACKKEEVHARIVTVGCIGHCYAEPIVVISKQGYPPICYHHVTPPIASLLVKRFLKEDDPCFEFVLGALEENDLIPSIIDLPRFALEERLLLRYCGLIDPENINHYIGNGGYEALVKVLGISPEDVIMEIQKSGLRGRGGAGFPTGKKWKICYETPEVSKYVICNADEGDPGAFMDRAILESNPHQIIEGIIIAGYAVGASQAYIYIRDEYPLAVERLSGALKQAEEFKLVGDRILGSDFSFHIYIFKGSGAFVCGEETAMIQSIEGRRGMPSHRPPYPAIKGLRGKPTVINNVKTLSCIPYIISEGAEAFSSVGTETSTGTMVFSLVGKVNNQGLVEVPMGTTLRKMIFEVCSGIPYNKNFKAVQIGGPSGGCLPESLLDTPIEFDSLTDAGAMMGSGGMVVLDEDDCIVEVTRYFLEFTQRESCGKCTFCRIGTKQMLETLTAITRGEGEIGDIDFLERLAEDIKTGSLCNLGKTAPNPVLTSIRYFREEYEAHIIERKCPAFQCRSLIAFYIVPEKCAKACDACVGTCPVEAVFTGKKGKKVIDQDKCIKCGECIRACPPQYDAVIKLSPKDTVPVD